MQSASRLEDLKQEKQEMQKLADLLELKFQKKLSEYRPQIRAWRQKLGFLADELQSARDRCKKARRSGNQQRARALSEKSDQLYARCKALKDNINSSASELRTIEASQRACVQKVRELKRQISRLSKESSANDIDTGTPAPPSVPIEIENFSEGVGPSKDELIRFLDRFPSQLCQAVDKIIFVDKPLNQSGRKFSAGRIQIQEPFGSNLVYVVTQDCREQRKRRNPRSTKEIIAHEFAHAFYYLLMDRQEQREWEQVYRRATDFVSNYAKTNPEEDFAESFAEYWLRPATLPSIDPLKYDFIKRMEEKYNQS